MSKSILGLIRDLCGAGVSCNKKINFASSVQDLQQMTFVTKSMRRVKTENKLTSGVCDEEDLRSK